MSHENPNDSNAPESTPPPGSGDAATAAAASSSGGLRLMILVLACVLVGLLAFQAGRAALPQASDSTMRRVIGLDRPVVNRLDPRYRDTNNDLVADQPVDPAALLDPDPIVFSYIASPAAINDLTGWADFVEHLESALGRSVEHRVIIDRNAQLRALRDGQVHLTAFNTGGVPAAVNAAGFVPVATPGVENEPQQYRMVLIVPSDSSIASTQDLRGAGHNIAFTDPSSNSGYKAPLVILETDFDIRVERDYHIVYSYSHRASIEGVARGDYAVAATASDYLDRMIEQGVINADEVRVIYESEPFPTAVIGYACNLKPDLAGRIREAILSFSFSGTSVAGYFEGQRADRFLPVNYKDEFALVRRIDDATGFKHEVRDSSPQPEPAPSEPTAPDAGSDADAAAVLPHRSLRPAA